MQRKILLGRVKQLGIIFGVWTILALIPGIQAHAYIASLGRPITWAHALMPPLLNHWIWAALTPGVFWLSGRYPIERRAWARVVGIHLLGSFAFAVLHIVLRCPFIRSATLFTTPPAHITWLLIRNSLFANYYDDLWMYSALVAFKQLWDYYRKYKDRELRTAKLEAQLVQAQLQVLKMQLNPHFLFNTLHAISSLMHEDVEAADNMVARLSDLLRMSLEAVNEQEIPFKREMEFLEGYLDIQQIRFRDRLKVRIDVPAASLDALVPNMILQPLVENAVTHGVATRSTPGEIQIRASREDSTLRLEVADSGGSIPDSQEPPHYGVGLANTRARLRQLYGDAHNFRMEKRPGGGTLVTLEIPYRTFDDSHA
jgi:signal transduction histidine kinase